jgi:hypothetical protein
MFAVKGLLVTDEGAIRGVVVDNVVEIVGFESGTDLTSSWQASSTSIEVGFTE